MLTNCAAKGGVIMPHDKYIGMELSKVNNMIRRDYSKTDIKKKVDDATGKNGWIIGYLAENSDKDIFQKDIEERFYLRRSTVSNMIQLMEKKGYITREAVSYDARLKKLTLTPKAWEIQRLMLRNIIDHEDKMRRNIAEEELCVFFNVLEKIQRNLTDEGGTEK